MLAASAALLATAFLSACGGNGDLVQATRDLLHDSSLDVADATTTEKPATVDASENELDLAIEFTKGGGDWVQTGCSVIGGTSAPGLSSANDACSQLGLR